LPIKEIKRKRCYENKKIRGWNTGKRERERVKSEEKRSHVE
jgi:hypothetical protein